MTAYEEAVINNIDAEMEKRKASHEEEHQETDDEEKIKEFFAIIENLGHSCESQKNRVDELKGESRAVKEAKVEELFGFHHLNGRILRSNTLTRKTP